MNWYAEIARSYFARWLRQWYESRSGIRAGSSPGSAKN